MSGHWSWACSRLKLSILPRVPLSVFSEVAQPSSYLDYYLYTVHMLVATISSDSKVRNANAFPPS
jgi:hypothetical protein